ncbi:MAG TPA: ubiquinol-cytochrome c reductase iron-sulfur subunit [Thermoanaerobaculia bacterium]|jgi:cytochrome b6-f complex iron-sulfur subunit|nr:ubiquinol-cytochrome c reductase iron-sulfur subunit [Thermoanaerobaculia bacterium]
MSNPAQDTGHDSGRGGGSLSRRNLINWFLGTTFGALILSILYPVIRFITPPRVPEASTNQVDAGQTDDPELLQKGFKIIRFGAEPVILLKAAENDYRAFSATCTHLACIVTYEKARTRIYCNCHGGVYDMTGRNVAGPPPRPLAPFKVNLVAKGPGVSSIVVSKA